MHDEELLEVWNRGASRSMWQTVRARGVEVGDDGQVAMADQELAGLPDPLAALAANRVLVRRLVGSRWIVIMLAREAGASWAQVAEALETTEDVVIAEYTAAIAAQERYVGDLHDAAQARAVLQPGAEVAR